MRREADCSCCQSVEQGIEILCRYMGKAPPREVFLILYSSNPTHLIVFIGQFNKSCWSHHSTHWLAPLRHPIFKLPENSGKSATLARIAPTKPSSTLVDSCTQHRPSSPPHDRRLADDQRKRLQMSYSSSAILCLVLERSPVNSTDFSSLYYSKSDC